MTNQVNMSFCKWCAVEHERGENTLCPLTIAEARLDRVKKLPQRWRIITGQCRPHSVHKCINELVSALKVILP